MSDEISERSVNAAEKFMISRSFVFVSHEKIPYKLLNAVSNYTLNLN